MAKKNQSNRLTEQHEKSKGVVGIFGIDAKLHDITISEISHKIKEQLEQDYPQLSFRCRKNIKKQKLMTHYKK